MIGKIQFFSCRFLRQAPVPPNGEIDRSWNSTNPVYVGLRALCTHCSRDRAKWQMEKTMISPEFEFSCLQLSKPFLPVVWDSCQGYLDMFETIVACRYLASIHRKMLLAPGNKTMFESSSQRCTEGTETQNVFYDYVSFLDCSLLSGRTSHMSPGKSWEFWMFPKTPCFKIYLSHVDLAEIEDVDPIRKR